MRLHVQLAVGGVAVAVITILCTSLVNSVVTEPYMDEPFHVPQTQRYCKGDFGTWDPKITTFPGVYIAAVLHVGAVAAMCALGGASFEWCSLEQLRFVNATMAVGCFATLLLIMHRLHGNHGARSLLHALCAACLPMHLFFSSLFYTDTGAALWVLLTYLLSLPAAKGGVPLSCQRSTSVALAGAAAILFRQTNAVWLAFTLGTMLLADLQLRHPRVLDRKRPASARATALGLLVVRDVPRLLLLAWPIVAVLCMFAGFVYWNGSVVVGDKEHHTPVLHWAQLVHCCTVAAAAGGFDALRPRERLRPLLHFLAPWGSPRKMLAWLALAALVTAALQWGSHLHPFLLADNRHFTFYIARHLLQGSPWTRHALLPLHMAAAWLVLNRLQERQCDLWIAGFAVACALVLVPAHLLELRYFVAPTLLLLCQMRPPPTFISALTLAAFLAVHAATMGLFLAKPFLWGDGSVARFMW